MVPLRGPGRGGGSPRFDGARGGLPGAKVRPGASSVVEAAARPFLGGARAGCDAEAGGAGAKGPSQLVFGAGAAAGGPGLGPRAVQGRQNRTGRTCWKAAGRKFGAEFGTLPSPSPGRTRPARYMSTRPGPMMETEGSRGEVTRRAEGTNPVAGGGAPANQRPPGVRLPLTAQLGPLPWVSSRLFFSPVEGGREGFWVAARRRPVPPCPLYAPFVPCADCGLEAHGPRSKRNGANS